ncbi:metal-dependent hydrolase family protein [Propylenella binzhouense]|uniref:Amidohydrolase family protein n=1 Tax=Propylenella binzhouense TaxID=2555902 RepID=A0A964T1C3_9HYPH|nr:amidohydrolase family protein [Propylenella binzhouense]MYZ46434.1 amidohydrolase family protein [Propylenella binzhouense]
MADIIFANARLLDGRTEDGLPDHHLRVSGDRLAEISDRPIKSQSARTIDLKGRTLMPGLIDCHVHVCAAMTNLGLNGLMPDALVALHAAKIMQGMLHRGFTTVRDAGGATYALVEAQKSGLIAGPRLVIGGKALSQTGGHADFRGRYDTTPAHVQADRLGALGRICDGIAECRQAARDEIRKGADYIKIMANGGVSSPTDRIEFLGFAEDEIAAIVEEAEKAHTYVAAHLYTDESIERAVRLGVRSIEHASLIEPQTARLMKEKGAYACPTMVIFWANKTEGREVGIPDHAIAKVETVLARGKEALDILAAAGVPMAFGTDLMGVMHRHQSHEFLLRAEVLPAIEVIRSATVVAAELLEMEGEIGILEPGARADLIVVDGDPVGDLRLLTEQGRHMPFIMQDGEFVKQDE